MTSTPQSAARFVVPRGTAAPAAALAAALAPALAAALAAALLATACGDAVAPRPASVAGTWRGQIATPSFPAGRQDSLVLTMAPRGASPDTLAGTFYFWFPGPCPVGGPAFARAGAGCRVSGALAGVRAGDAIALDLTYDPCGGPPGCSPISKRGPAALRPDGGLDVSVGDYWPREAATGTLRRD